LISKVILVCIKVLGDVMTDMSGDDASNADKVAEKICEYCGSATGKEQKFVNIYFDI